MKTYSLFILLFILLISCVDENPDLVNPPDNSATIRYRIVNFAIDGASRELKLVGGDASESIHWGILSEANNPPADTGFIQILKNGNLEYETPNLVRFIRNTNYTYFALNSTDCNGANNCPIDTLIGLRTTIAIPDNNFESLLKFINVYPDPNIRIGIREGCPNGNILFSAMNYLQYSISPITVRSGELNFSVVTSSQEGDKSLNLYSVELNAKGQYTIVAHEGQNGEIEISILNEDDLTNEALRPATIVQAKETDLRPINISNSEISLEMRNIGVISPNISSNYIDKYETIGACLSSFQDTIDVISNNVVKSSIITSLDVLSKYSLLIYNVDADSLGSILLAPPKLNVETAGKSIIRIVNTLDYAVDVSVGARKELDISKYPSGYSAGISLSQNLDFAEVSSFSVVSQGPAPINVFSSIAPARLIFSTNTYFEPDKEYTLVISQGNGDEIKLSMISKEDENINVDFLQKGIFVQVINAMSDNGTAKIDLSSTITGLPILENADLYITNSLATVLDFTQQSIIINGTQYNIDATTDQRVIIVVGGNQAESNVLIDKVAPLTENKRFRVRYVNMTADLPIMSLKKNDNDETYIENVEINTFSSYGYETREQKPTYFFYDGDNPDYVARFSDVTMSLGKSYCIILYGTSSRECLKHVYRSPLVEPTCYSFIIQQEF